MHFLFFKYRKSIFLISLLSFVFVGCDNLDNRIISSKELIDTEKIDYQTGVGITLQRARQITDTQWVPLKRIPKTRPEGKYFEPGKIYKGIPYSSVKELSKFVGQDVSIHTFLSAVSNPRSVLYTEFVNASPYHGKNCAPYYGIVCSMSVNYALGIEAPFPSRSYASADFMQKVTDSDVDSIKVCDVLASSGHTIMAVNVVKDSIDRLKEVQFLENSYYISFTREDLQEYWKKGKFVLYRYRNIAKNTSILEIEPVVSNPSLCPNRGDKSVYRTDERIVLNVLNNTYDKLEIYKDGNLIEIHTILGEDIILDDFKEGLYSARLIAEGKESEFTYFEVRPAMIEVLKANHLIFVSFLKNTIPAVSIELCDIQGDHLYTHALSEEEKQSGVIQVEELEREAPYYCKVIFQGEYGKISSAYIQIKE